MFLPPVALGAGEIVAAPFIVVYDKVIGFPVGAWIWLIMEEMR